MPQRKKQIDPAEQRQRFIAAARKLGCDEDEAVFDERLRRIGKAKPQERQKSAAKRSGKK